MPDDATSPPDLVIGVELDGTRYDYKPYDVTPRQASALRRQSEGAWRSVELNRAVLADDGLSCGPDEIAGLVFMARIQAGEKVTYGEVADAITAASRAVIHFDVAEFDPQEIDSPEA